MIKTSKYVVGYVDLLGAKSKTIQDDENNKNLNSLNDLYQMAKKTREFMRDELKNPNLHIKIFSDNVAVVQKIGATEYDAGAAVIGFLLHFQFFAWMKEQWLMRGCVTCGDLYVDDAFVWGKALIEAYTGENELAIYPRIVLTPKLLGKLHLDKFKKSEQSIDMDFDGEYYLRFYDILNIYKPVSRKKRLADIRENLVAMLKDTQKQPKLKQKTVWLVHQHNAYCAANDMPDFAIELRKQI